MLFLRERNERTVTERMGTAMVSTPYRIGTTELKNRWVMLAMHTGFAAGNALTERDLAFYEERAKGGAAAVTCLLAVDAAGALRGMYDAESVEPESLRTLAARVHAQDCRLIVQLFHCGRNESRENHGEKPLLAPSAVPSPIFRAEPQEMTAADLAETKRAFARAAALCKECGADLVEVSASAGYLLSSFLSPLTNLRTDAYGVQADGGIAYPLEVLAAVREAVGDFPVLMKVSGAQMLAGGYELADTVRFCKEAAVRGLIDGVTVTGGWHESPTEQISYHVPKGGYAHFAAAVKEAIDLPVIACNRIADGETAERLLAAGACDFCGAARAFLADAAFADRVAAGEPYLPCQGCNRCIMDVLKGKEISCAYNPEAGREYTEHQRRKIATRKEIIVIGGGAGGMEAAKKAAERGFRTTLLCKEKELGGQLRLAALPPKKGDLLRYIDYMRATLEALQVTILTETEGTLAWMREKQPYFTVIATGSTPKRGTLAGLAAAHSFTAQEVLSMAQADLAAVCGGSVAVIGGGAVGLDTAAFLAERMAGEDITVLEQAAKMGKALGAMARPLLAELREAGVRCLTNAALQEVRDGTLYAVCGGESVSVAADTVIWAIGGESAADTELTMWLMDERLSYALIGDAEQVGDAGDAIGSAYELFTRLYLA